MQSATGFGCSVIHHQVQTRISLEELLQKHFLFHIDLISLGAIYLEKERLSHSIELQPGQILRIHSRPKRYPVQQYFWPERVLAENEFWLLVHKPAGIPCHPTLDNQKENVLIQMSEALGKRLFVTHRLDVPTEGLLLLAKTTAAQTEINQIFQSSQIEKIYEADSPFPTPLGFYQHWMQNSPRAPKKIFSSPAQDRKECRLEILSCEKKETFYRHKIKLLTGRTHQIRAQMAFLGSPICGDSLYGAKEANSDSISLKAIELHGNKNLPMGLSEKFYLR